MRRISVLTLLAVLVLSVGSVGRPALAQEGEQESVSPDLTIFTRYPSQVVELGETTTFDLTLRATGAAQTVRLAMENAPEGWTTTFRGGGEVIRAVYVEPDNEASVDLRLQPPEDVAAGTYEFVVSARGDGISEELPLELTVEERLPPNLSFDVELPTLRGTASSTFRYDATLQNEGDEDLTVNLVANAPSGFQVSFSLSGQDVTSIPINANETKRLDIEVQPVTNVPAGTYDIQVLAQGGEVEASQTLTAEVTGQPELTVTSPDERLSGNAYAGQQTPLKVVVQNTGSAPARNVELSASTPSGWSVEFEPSRLDELSAGKQVEVTANVQPGEQAVAGDYMITMRAEGEGGASDSAEFRITVLTSTLWGVVGIGLIAVAVLVVGLAVVRFGRR